MAHIDDLVEVTNPTGEDFHFEYGKHPYVLKVGEKRTFMRKVGQHVVKHLTNREILKKDKLKGPKLHDQELRKEWHDKIFLGVSQSFQPGANGGSEGERIAYQQEMQAKELESRIKELEQKYAKPNQSVPTGSGERSGEQDEDASGRDRTKDGKFTSGKGKSGAGKKGASK